MEPPCGRVPGLLLALQRSLLDPHCGPGDLRGEGSAGGRQRWEQPCRRTLPTPASAKHRGNPSWIPASTWWDPPGIYPRGTHRAAGRVPPQPPPAGTDPAPLRRLPSPPRSGAGGGGSPRDPVLRGSPADNRRLSRRFLSPAASGGCRREPRAGCHAWGSRCRAGSRPAGKRCCGCWTPGWSDAWRYIRHTSPCPGTGRTPTAAG